MKKTPFLHICRVGIILLSILLFSCTGDEGPVGPVGPEGPAGVAGPAGEDGSILYSGTTDPASTVGVDGDYYLNTTTGELFGPKTSGQWTDSFMLKGEDGADGATILSGTSTPGQETGSEGDFYLDTDDILLYGPKTATGWGAGLELKGADGNANVKTYNLSILMDEWSKITFLNSTFFTRRITFPALTEDIHENGAVLIYLKDAYSEGLSSYVVYNILPYTQLMPTGNVRSLICDIRKDVNTLLQVPPLPPITTTEYSLEFTYQFGWEVVGGLSFDYTFKIVLIQGEFATMANELKDKGLEYLAEEFCFSL